MTPPVGFAAALLAALALAAFLLRRRMPHGPRNLRLEERLSLGSNSVLWIVRVDGRRFLLAAGGKEASVLVELGAEPQRARAASPGGAR